MANPFDDSGNANGGGRLIGRRKAEAAAAVEALLAKADRVTDVSQADVAAACKQCGIDSSRQVRKEFKNLYGRYLDFCFEDRKLTPEESVDLEHLKQILQLGDADVSTVQDDVAISVYGSAVAEVLEDLKIDEEESDFLRRLREELKLPESRAERILEDSAREARDRVMQHATSGDETFIRAREAAGEFTGRSTRGLEAAIDNALGKAGLAIPDLHWFEVSQLAGYVEQGAASNWYVVLKAGIRRED